MIYEELIPSDHLLRRMAKLQAMGTEPPRVDCARMQTAKGEASRKAEI
jgi:hypothetical protein